MTTPSATVVEVLEDGSQVVEVTTTEKPEDEYDIQIQGSDRKYPAILLRRRHRGEGATLRTISKNGKYASLYPEYREVIDKYLERRAKRLDNTQDNSLPDGESPTTLRPGEGGAEEPGNGWIDKALQSVVTRRTTDSEDPH